MNLKYDRRADGTVFLEIWMKGKVVGMMFITVEEFNELLTDIRHGRNCVHRIEQMTE